MYLNIVGEEQDDGSTLYTYTAYSDADMTTDALYSYTSVAWPADWTMYIFDGTKNGDAKFGVYAEGWFAVGTQDQVESYVGSANGATTGYWGYVDGELTFVRVSTDYSMDESNNLVMTDTYYVCEMTTNSDGSVTISDSNGTAITGTIPDIGCLVGDGYDLSGFDLIYPEAE